MDTEKKQLLCAQNYPRWQHCNVFTFSTAVLLAQFHFLVFHFIQNQIQKEIRYTFGAIPGMGLLTAIVFLFEVRGYSKLYDNVHDSQYGEYTFLFGEVLRLSFFYLLDYIPAAL